jgi:predicted Zn-dependent protease
MAKKEILVFFLVLSISLSTFGVLEARAQQVYVLALQGPTWNHSVLTVLVIPQYDQAWWNPGYLNSTLHAISQWNEALSYFATNHSEFAHLSRLTMVPQVSNITLYGFDAYLSWVEQFGNETCEAGLTRTTYNSLNVIANSTITLSALDCLGNVLSEVDMQNVALHELGHCWGLGHANFTGDVMYYAYTLNSPVRAVSTLDVYGLSQVFRWMASSEAYEPINQGSPIYSVALPANIDYEYLPISENNIPPQTTIDQIKSFLDGFTQFILQPEVLVLILLAVSAIAAYAAISRSRRMRISSL